MTRADRILIVIVACAVLLSVPLVSAASSATASRAIVAAPGGRSTIDLSTDRMYEIQGRRGVVEIRVASGKIECLSADCPDRICVAMGVARAGRPIVCAPNGVSVSLSSSKKGELDALSR